MISILNQIEWILYFILPLLFVVFVSFCIWIYLQFKLLNEFMVETEKYLKSKKLKGGIENAKKIH